MKGEGVSKENGTARIGTKSKLKHWREREGKAAEEKELKKVCVSTKKQIPRKTQQWGLRKDYFNFSRRGQSFCNCIRVLRVENKGIPFVRSYIMDVHARFYISSYLLSFVAV